MKRLSTLVMMAMLLGAMLVPAQTVSAQSDGDALCAEALAAADAGATSFQGYKIVYGSGGSGSQVVLGSPNSETLFGRSGNDLLCGFGGDDQLYGGSGNDILISGTGVDQLYGESGGDTLYGDTGDTVIDGGTGNNQEFVAQGPQATVTIVSVTYFSGAVILVVTATGFAPNSPVTEFVFLDPSQGEINSAALLSISTDSAGAFNNTTIGSVCRDGESYVRITDSAGNSATATLTVDCP